jgi:hypothetical protein
VPTPGGDYPADLGHHRFDEIRREKLHAGLTIGGSHESSAARTRHNSTVAERKAS